LKQNNAILLHAGDETRSNDCGGGKLLATLHRSTEFSFGIEFEVGTVFEVTANPEPLNKPARAPKSRR
jgi:hypothetical protein